MKIVKSTISFMDRYLGKDSGKKEESKTYKEERLVAEKAALDHEQKRIAQASKYPNAPTPELKRAFTPESSDQEVIVNEAGKYLRDYINDLFGKHTSNLKKKRASSGGGMDIEAEDFKTREGHKDISDNSDVTDNALIAFSCKFTLPGLNKYRVAKFVVSYNSKSDFPYNVENKFYDESENEYELNSESLDKFLKNAEIEDVNKTKDTPIVFHNAEYNTYEAVSTTEPSEKIVARLVSAGYKVDRNIWVDTTYGKDFGRLCFCVQVSHEQVPTFKKIAAMSDDEWFNRASESESIAPFKQKEKEWNDRALDNSNTQEDLKKGTDWVNRAAEPTGHGNVGNPYNSETKMLFADGAKKPSEAENKNKIEAAKKNLASKDAAVTDVAKSIKDLEDLIK